MSQDFGFVVDGTECIALNVFGRCIHGECNVSLHFVSNILKNSSSFKCLQICKKVFKLKMYIYIYIYIYRTILNAS